MDIERYGAITMQFSAYQKYLLGVLTSLLTFNYMDRVGLGIVLQQIKVDLALSDLQLGLLTGIAFALFYSLVGIPIARWADRGNRVIIISITAALASILVALCGRVSNFSQLIALRVGVSVGESGCFPAGNSLIADVFPRANRPRASALYLLGAPISMLVGYEFAGWIDQSYGWRTLFALMGLPGLAIALLAVLTLREPRRSADKKNRLRSQNTHSNRGIHESRAGSELSVMEAAEALWKNRTYRQLLLCFSFASFFVNGILQWQPTFFIRSYGAKPLELGTWFAVVYGIGGFIGTYIGGHAASRWAQNDERTQLRCMAAIFSAVSVVSAGVYIARDVRVSLALTAVCSFCGALFNGPLFATIQSLVNPRMRAIAVSILSLSASLIGLGLGPVVAGMLSDLLAPVAGVNSLRYSLLMLCPGYLLVAFYLLRASRTVSVDIQAAEIEGSN